MDSITIDGKTVRPQTDTLGRNMGKVIEVDNAKIAEEKISYVKFGDHATNLPSTIRFASNGVFKESMQYRYDSMGNIVEIFENGRSACRYEYDALGRLTREDNVAFGKTTTWAYDNNGNIIARYEYAITAKPTAELHLLNCTTFTYCYAENSDQLLSITKDDGSTVTTELFEYDAIGNPETYRGTSATWQYGRQLATYKDSTYTYDARGRRTKKEIAVRNEEGNLTEEVIETSYIYDSNGNLIKQSNGLEFLYDHTGVFAVKHGTQTYFYRKDAQGNIVELLDSDGDTVVKYKYDAWGNCKVLNANGTEIADDTHIGILNPFRYRSYYYDDETKLYFLKTRYYDPEISRFMTIDDLSYLDPDSINGLNLYAYCGNNPVNNADSTGTFAISTFLIGLAISFVATWVAGEIFGHQLVGGICSAVGGGSAIATGISLFAFGPVGWVIGGIAIIAGAASIAFGTAEIQEHFTGNNWIQDSFGWSDGLYNGLYFASNIVATVASVGGTFYKTTTHGQIAYNAKYWDKGTFPNSRASLRYHYDKHGAGMTVAEYTNAARSFMNRNASVLTYTYNYKLNNVSWYFNYLYGHGGYFTSGGKILTFW